jgi:hypothetical protein
MAHDDDQDSSWAKQLLLGVGALVAGALVVGVVVGLVVVAGVNVLGLGGSSGGPEAEPTLYIPSGVPTTAPETFPNPNQASSSPPSPSATQSSPTDSPTPHKPHKPRKEIALQAFPRKVAAGQRINLTGVYQGGEGASLQVQRFENGWTDFPVTATVSGGLFNTWVTTSRTGDLRFRVLDRASGRHSNAVRVTVG